MPGLEKIIADINRDAKCEADAILLKAKEEAEKTLEAARLEAERFRSEEEKKIKQDEEQVLRRAKAGAALNKRQRLLAAKQKAIGDTLKEAKRRILDKPAEEYFAALKRLALETALPKAGEICFGKRDMERLPEGFLESLNLKLAERGASLSLSDTPRKIDGGFILAYGGIEENCSLQAIFDANREKLQDLVQKVLFTDSVR